MVYKNNIEEFCNLLINDPNFDIKTNYAFSHLIENMHNTQALLTSLSNIML